MATNDKTLWPALIVGLGLAFAGIFIGHGFSTGRRADRFVEVKGLAEREVRADVALWPLRYVAAASDLATAQQMIARNTTDVMAFLRRHGLDSTAVEMRQLDVYDANANRYQGERAGPRFIVQQTAMVRSGNPDVVLAASQKVGELVSAGVVLTSEGDYRGSTGPTFLFTKLNDMKPEMIAEATSNARAAADQFARDSRTSVGAIRQANQGLFVILARDQAPGLDESSQIAKIVRVVSTVQYFLK